MRVHVVDPGAYTPPYDHALCTALAAAGADVDLYTGRFAYGPPAQPEGYRRHELFYRRGAHVGNRRVRRAVRLAEHVPDMLRYRRLAGAADVVHFQWLVVQYLDGLLLPARRPSGYPRARPALVLTAHDILPREPWPGQSAAQRRLYDRFDAVVVHTERGRERLVGELGVKDELVHVIAHGALTHLTASSPEGDAEMEAPREASLPEAPLRTDGAGSVASAATAPVVMCFGLMRPYKGIDLLVEAWRGIEHAELWIVGAPRMDITALQASAPAGVRFVPRFVSDAELPGYFRRADLIVLPYREIEQSGVLFTALAFAKPLLLSDVGGFPEIAATGAARTFPAGDAQALHVALRELLADPTVLSAMAGAARDAAAGEYAWGAIAQRTLALYAQLLAS